MIQGINREYINSKFFKSIFESRNDCLERLFNIEYVNLNLEKEKSDLIAI